MTLRILDIASDQRTPEQERIFEKLTQGRGRILTPYRVWIHSPAVAAPMEQLGTFLNKRSSLSPREVEIAILIVAAHWRADYVLHAHMKAGRAAGLDETTIDKLRSGELAHFQEPHERSVYGFVNAMVQGRKLSDSQFADYEAELRREGIAELLAMIGYYTSVSLAMNVHDVHPEQ